MLKISSHLLSDLDDADREVHKTIKRRESSVSRSRRWEIFIHFKVVNKNTRGLEKRVEMDENCLVVVMRWKKALIESEPSEWDFFLYSQLYINLLIIHK